MIQMLADIVSKNGNLLLNFPPRPGRHARRRRAGRSSTGWPPGCRSTARRSSARGRGRFLAKSPRKLQGGKFNEGTLRYTAQDIRFTTKGEVLYAIALGWPEDRRLAVRSLAAAAGKITGVTLLGHSGDLPWSQTADGLIVTLPDKKPCEHAFALKILGGNLEPVTVAEKRNGHSARRQRQDRFIGTRSRNHRHYAPI